MRNAIRCFKVRVGFTHHILDLAAEKCEGEKPLLFILDPAKEDPQPKKKPRKPKGKEPKARPDMDRLTSSPIVLPVLPSAFHIRSMCVGELRLQPQASAVTFGNKFNLEKLINCRALQVAWRVRPAFMLVSHCFRCPWPGWNHQSRAQSLSLSDQSAS